MTRVPPLALGFAVAFGGLAVLALPAASQPVSPDTVLAYLWPEAISGARAAADAVDDALAEDSLDTDAPDLAAAFRRGIVVASGAAAAAASHVSAATQFAIALAPPDRQEAVEAALTEPAVGLYEALLTVTVGARDTVSRPAAEAMDRAAWRESAGYIRLFADALADAVAGLDP